jgi:F-type H+-transporting ATPase subunit b
MNLEIGQIISQIFAFLIMLWVLRRFAWKPLLNLLEERKRKIQEEFDSIEAEKKQIENLKSTYGQKLKEIDATAKAKMQEEVERGRKVAQEIEEDAHKQASLITAKAQENISREQEEAKEQLKHVLVNLTIKATEKILKESLDSDTSKKIVASYVDKINFT